MPQRRVPGRLCSDAVAVAARATIARTMGGSSAAALQASRHAPLPWVRACRGSSCGCGAFQHVTNDRAVVADQAVDSTAYCRCCTARGRSRRADLAHSAWSWGQAFRHQEHEHEHEHELR